MSVRILEGDTRDVLRTLPAESVQCVVTSPPYFGLRDYQTAQWSGGWDPNCTHKSKVWERRGKTKVQVCVLCGAVKTDDQIGNEDDPAAYVAEMVGVFSQVKHVLRDDGVVFLNLGDSYSSGGRSTRAVDAKLTARACDTRPDDGFKPKDLLMIPARVAIALQADGWFLRSDIIWHKPNPMPESVTDRPTSAHEHVFLLTKRERYFYDAGAIAEDAFAEGRIPGGNRKVDSSRNDAGRDMSIPVGATRNARNVWTIATQPYSGAHFATMPPELAERCIRAGSRPGDTILDPFSGAGTTALVADRLQRNAIGIELNPEYAALSRSRITQDAGLFGAVA